MSELLRAVLDATAIDSNPAFYTSRLTLVLPGGSGANAYAERSAFIDLKTDTWFLMMGWAQSIAGPGGVWEPANFASAFTLRDVQTSRRFNSLDQVQKVDQNFNLNNFVTLPEYHLWEPSALIEVIQLVQTATTIAGPQTCNNIVTLAGIEYKLPDKPGGYFNGR